MDFFFFLSSLNGAAAAGQRHPSGSSDDPSSEFENLQISEDVDYSDERVSQPRKDFNLKSGVHPLNGAAAQRHPFGGSNDASSEFENLQLWKDGDHSDERVSLPPKDFNQRSGNRPPNGAASHRHSSGGSDDASSEFENLQLSKDGDYSDERVSQPRKDFNLKSGVHPLNGAAAQRHPFGGSNDASSEFENLQLWKDGDHSDERVSLPPKDFNQRSGNRPPNGAASHRHSSGGSDDASSEFENLQLSKDGDYSDERVTTRPRKDFNHRSGNLSSKEPIVEPSEQTGHVLVREMAEQLNLAEKKKQMELTSEKRKSDRQRFEQDFEAAKIEETSITKDVEKQFYEEPNDGRHKNFSDHRNVENTYVSGKYEENSFSEEGKNVEEPSCEDGKNVEKQFVERRKTNEKSFHEEAKDADKSLVKGGKNDKELSDDDVKNSGKQVSEEKNGEKSFHEEPKEGQPQMSYAKVVSNHLKNEDQKKVGQKQTDDDSSKKSTEPKRLQAEVKAPPKPEPDPMKEYNHRHEESDIEVTFEVLLSPEMASFVKNVFIIFGSPLSDWNTQMVQMRQKENVEPGNYIYLTGTLPLNLKYKSKSIPYKYVVKNEEGNVKWEDINIAASSIGGEINRCLVVPDKVESKFTKFDDVILPKGVKNHLQSQRQGREVATRWMLPSPKDFDDPDFDFEAICERFSLVIKTFGNNGTRLCVGETPRGFFNPSGFSIESVVSKQLKNFFKRFETYLDENDLGKLLRIALYFCVVSIYQVGNAKFFQIDELGQFLIIFEAFRRCKEMLPNQLPRSIDGDIQGRICDALKKLVQSFVNLPVNM